MRRTGLGVLLLIVLGIVSPGGAAAVSVSAGAIGDALIFQLIETTNIDTQIAIENHVGGATVAKVRFRAAATGTATEFTLCLPTNSTWTATVFRDGSLTKVTSTSTFLINGDPTPLNTTLTGNPTRAFMEVIGLRTGSAVQGTTVCTDPALGGDVSNSALTGRAFYVNGSQSPPLAYGANAVALEDFAVVKISDGTVFGSDLVAQALIAQGTFGFGFDSTRFITRYFVAASFGAVTQVVLTFPTGPNSVGCPSCYVPSTIRIRPNTDAGASLTLIDVPDTSLVRVISLTSSDIANDSGLLHIGDTVGVTPIPVVGLGIITTTPSAPTFFNIMSPLAIN
jgi:hypothetical protein